MRIQHKVSQAWSPCLSDMKSLLRPHIVHHSWTNGTRNPRQHLGIPTSGCHLVKACGWDRHRCTKRLTHPATECHEFERKKMASKPNMNLGLFFFWRIGVAWPIAFKGDNLRDYLSVEWLAVGQAWLALPGTNLFKTASMSGKKMMIGLFFTADILWEFLCFRWSTLLAHCYMYPLNQEYFRRGLVNKKW